ncbi:macrolide ABC transporter permease [Sporosarcina ureilytica]|uniref:Macrolide ABC transporter permease n=2 Tax=Sporosarcina ureilytica TaxID=298596 RepID=A0A1D8JK15_9BACL|nr:macrolide ABC transporter permease [Sporosarcina ureilytica]
MRVFMTVLAATMGTAFLIVLASVGFGLHETLRDEMLSNRLVTEIQVYEGETSGAPSDKVEQFTQLAHVKTVLNQQRLGTEQMTKMGSFGGYHELVVSNFAEEAKVGFELEEGRLPEKWNEVVVGSHFGQSLYEDVEVADGEEIPTYKGKLIGEQFSYAIENADGEFAEEELTFTIVGVGKNPTKEWEYDQRVFADDSVIPELEKIYTSNTGQTDTVNLFYNNVLVYADKLENVSQVSTTIRDEGFYVYSISDELDQMDVFFLALKAGLIFVGTIAILIASIGIFNTMTMAVTERTREIGVMKAIGANPKLIQRLFIMESAWIGVLGTVIAIILSYGISMIANYLLPIIVMSALGEEDLEGLNVTFSVIPWQLILIASAISIGVAVLSGWRPARKATKIDVINALRQEL